MWRPFPVLGSRTAVKKTIAAGRLFCNGRLAGFSTRVKNGDRLELRGSGQQKARQFDLKVETVYEDDFLLVINKPAGIAVNGNRIKTVENAVAQRNQHNKQADALPRPIAVHRLDVPTLGLVILAKTKSALIELSKAFQKNKVKKTYWAIAHGKAPVKGSIQLKINGKPALTHFERLRLVPSRVFQHLSLLALYPQTGRTHQLRIHLQSEGHFIVGDKMYAQGQQTILGKGLYLCAAQLQFFHPFRKEALTLQVPLPAKFTRLLDREESRFAPKK
ncbi:MAG: RluA family pseudouridine synthase [Bacteroidota bacterium]